MPARLALVLAACLVAAPAHAVTLSFDFETGTFEDYAAQGVHLTGWGPGYFPDEPDVEFYRGPDIPDGGRAVRVGGGAYDLLIAFDFLASGARFDFADDGFRYPTGLYYMATRVWNSRGGPFTVLFTPVDLDGLLNQTVYVGGPGLEFDRMHIQIAFDRSSEPATSERIDNLVIQKVPEPATWMLLGLGLVGLGVVSRVSTVRAR